MTRLKVTQIGNSLGVILPRAVAVRLKVGKGDELNCSETQQGIELTSFDPDFQKKLESARRISKRYRNTLKELAK